MHYSATFGHLACLLLSTHNTNQGCMCLDFMHVHRVMSAGAGPVAGYTCVARQEYAGLEITSMNLDSLQLCVDACKSRTDCTFIVYSNDKMCSVKSDFQNGPDGSNGHSQWRLQSCIKDETGAANSSRGCGSTDGAPCFCQRR